MPRSSWLRLLSAPHAKTPRRGGQFASPQLEALEARWLPALLSLNPTTSLTEQISTPAEADLFQVELTEKSRLVAEYDLDAELEASPYDSARWLAGSEANIEKFAAGNRGGMAADRDGAPVFLAKSGWELGYVAEKFPDVKLLKTRERHEVQA